MEYIELDEIIIEPVMKEAYKRELNGEGIGSSRCTWKKHEDNLLSELVALHKGKNWRLVAEAISSQVRQKSAKQCRERWHTHLNPDINLTAWSKEEQTILLKMHKILGSKWSEIAEKLPGRTDNAVKNWFFCRLRKLLRTIKNFSIKSNSIGMDDVEQSAYLLNYLYTYYLSPDHQKNMKKIINLRIMGRKNQGDRYLHNMISKDQSLPYCFQKYVKFFVFNIPSFLVQNLLHSFPQLFLLASNELLSKGLSELYVLNLLNVPMS